MEQTHGIRHALGGLLALSTACFLAVTTEMLPVGLLPEIADAFSVSNSMAGLLVSVYAVMVAVFSIPLTLATQRIDRKLLLVSTLAVYTLSNLLAALAPSFLVVALARGLGGASHALFFSIAIGYASRLVNPLQMGKAMSIAAAGSSIGIVLGVPLSTTLGAFMSWRVAFWALTGLAALVTVIVFLTLPRVHVGAEPETTEDMPAKTRTHLLQIVSANGLHYLGQFTAYTFISVLLLNVGASDRSVGPILLVLGLCGFVGLTICGSLVDRKRRAVPLAVIAVSLVGLIGLALAPNLPFALASAIIWCSAAGGISIPYQAAAVRTKTVTPEIAGAWINATANIGIAAGAAVGGGALDVLGNWGPPAVACVLLVAAAVVILFSKKAF